MSSPVEYLSAHAFARKKGWRASGRAAWLKADGTTVYFICLEEQLAAVPVGAKIPQDRPSPYARRLMPRSLQAHIVTTWSTDGYSNL